MPSPTPFGRPGDAKKPHERLEAAVVDRLAAMRGPGESYSDVIVRLTPDAGCARGADSTPLLPLPVGRERAQILGKLP